MPNPGAETETENSFENNTETLSGKFSKAIGSINYGTKYVGSVLVHFGQEYNQGLFGLVVALVTFGIERLLDDQVFSCPRRQHDVYASTFLFVPGLVLLMVNLITVPAAGKFHIWTICERCFVKNYRQRGDCLTGLSSAICVGFVAPTVWFFLALLNGQHLVCWELGFQLGTNITKKYLRRRDINMTVTDYTDKVHDVKAKSQFIGAIVFGMVVFILVAVIVFKRSFIKPFDVNEKVSGMPANNEI